MLREILYVKQERKKDRRRWFTDEEWDLYVWVRGDGSFSGFQLCYDKTSHQNALTWMDGKTPVHTSVSEESRPGIGVKAAALLVGDESFNSREVLARFLHDSARIEPAVREYVRDKLAELG